MFNYSVDLVEQKNVQLNLRNQKNSNMLNTKDFILYCFTILENL